MEENKNINNENKTTSIEIHDKIEGDQEKNLHDLKKRFHYVQELLRKKSKDLDFYDTNIFSLTFDHVDDKTIYLNAASKFAQQIVNENYLSEIQNEFNKIKNTDYWFIVRYTEKKTKWWKKKKVWIPIVSTVAAAGLIAGVACGVTACVKSQVNDVNVVDTTKEVVVSETKGTGSVEIKFSDVPKGSTASVDLTNNNPTQQQVVIDESQNSKDIPITDKAASIKVKFATQPTQYTSSLYNLKVTFVNSYGKTQTSELNDLRLVFVPGSPQAKLFSYPTTVNASSLVEGVCEQPFVIKSEGKELAEGYSLEMIPEQGFEIPSGLRFKTNYLVWDDSLIEGIYKFKVKVTYGSSSDTSEVITLNVSEATISITGGDETISVKENNAGQASKKWQTRLNDAKVVVPDTIELVSDQTLPSNLKITQDGLLYWSSDVEPGQYKFTIKSTYKGLVTYSSSITFTVIETEFEIYGSNYIYFCEKDDGSCTYEAYFEDEGDVTSKVTWTWGELPDGFTANENKLSWGYDVAQGEYTTSLKAEYKGYTRNLSLYIWVDEYQTCLDINSETHVCDGFRDGITNNRILSEFSDGTLTIPKEVETISDEAFWGYLPDEITKLRFEDGSNLKNLNYCSFYKNKLEDVILPSSIKYVGTNPFGYNPLESIKFTDNKCENYTTQINGKEVNCLINKNNGTIITGVDPSKIPNDSSVSIIGGYAFAGSTKKVAANIPNNIVHINGGAFFDAKTVAFKFPNTLTTLDSDALEYANGSNLLDLTDWSADDINNASWNSWAFYNCENRGIIYAKDTDARDAWESKLYYSRQISQWTVIVTPFDRSIDEDGNYVLNGFRDGITPEQIEQIFEDTLVIDPFVTKIADNAFYRDEATTIPEALTKIEFYGDSHTTSIGANAFNSAPFTELSIPNVVSTIGEGAFANLGSLTKFDMNDWIDNLPNIDASTGWNPKAFTGLPTTGNCYVDESKTSGTWQEWADKMKEESEGDFNIADWTTSAFSRSMIANSDIFEVRESEIENYDITETFTVDLLMNRFRMWKYNEMIFDDSFENNTIIGDYATFNTTGWSSYIEPTIKKLRFTNTKNTYILNKNSFRSYSGMESFEEVDFGTNHNIIYGNAFESNYSLKKIIINPNTIFRYHYSYDPYYYEWYYSYSPFEYCNNLNCIDMSSFTTVEDIRNASWSVPEDPTNSDNLFASKSRASSGKVIVSNTSQTFLTELSAKLATAGLTIDGVNWVFEEA